LFELEHEALPYSNTESFQCNCNWNDRELLASLVATMSGLYDVASTSDINLVDGDQIDKGTSDAKSPVLSAEDWKYVLVGIQIAMTAG